MQLSLSAVSTELFFIYMLRSHKKLKMCWNYFSRWRWHMGHEIRHLSQLDSVVRWQTVTWTGKLYVWGFMLLWTNHWIVIITWSFKESMYQTKRNFISIAQSVHSNDVLFLVTRLAAYWPAPIHAVALLAYTVVTWLPARLAVCFSQLRYIFSSATAFTTATLRWQQLRYRTINRKN